MKKVARLVLAAVTTVSLIGLASPAAQAASWQCSGKLTARCITHTGSKVQVKFSNTTARSAKGEFGVTCFGSSGQWLKTFKNGTIEGYDTYKSPLYQCPSGEREGAFGWQISNGNVYYTPTVYF